MEVPPQFKRPDVNENCKNLASYLKHANNLDKTIQAMKDQSYPEEKTRELTIVACTIREYVLTLAMDVHKHLNETEPDRSKEAETAFLMGIMDVTEAQKSGLPPYTKDEQNMVTTAHAISILTDSAKKFKEYHQNENAAAGGESVAKVIISLKRIGQDFFTAGRLMDVLELFGALEEQIVKNKKFAMESAHSVNNSIRDLQVQQVSELVPATFDEAKAALTLHKWKSAAAVKSLRETVAALTDAERASREEAIQLEREGMPAAEGLSSSDPHGLPSVPGEAAQYAPMPAPAPAPQYAPMPAPVPQYAPAPAPMPQYAPAPAPAPLPQYAPAPTPMYAPAPMPAPVPQYAPAPAAMLGSVPQYTNALPHAPAMAPMQGGGTVNPTMASIEEALAHLQASNPAKAAQHLEESLRSLGAASPAAGGSSISPNRVAIDDAQELCTFAKACLNANDTNFAVQRLRESLALLKA